MVDKEKQILSSLSTANVYRLSCVKVSGTCVQPFQRYWGFGGLWVFCVFGFFLGYLRVLDVCGCFVFLGCLGVLGCFGGFGCFVVLGFWGVLGLSGVSGFGVFWGVWGLRLRG